MEFYYDVAKHEVVEGKQAGWENRMGPYATREEAEHALQKAAERNKIADEQDAADED